MGNLMDVPTMFMHLFYFCVSEFVQEEITFALSMEECSNQTP